MNAVLKSLANFILSTLALFLVFIGFCYLCSWFMEHPAVLVTVVVAGFIAVCYHEEKLSKEESR